MGSKSGSKSSGKAAAGKAGRPAKQQQQQKQKQNELAAAADDPFASTRSAADAADAADAGSGGLLFSLAWTSVLAYFLVAALISSYDIRTQAIEEYGTVIHEFDPWFNYRATEYLYEHGWRAFKSWYDYKVWYPLGRPVGTTIYPGMQVRV